MITGLDLVRQALEFVANDAVEGFLAQRQVGHHFHSCQQGRFEEAGQFRVEGFVQAGRGLGVVDDGLVAEVGGEEEDDIFAVDESAFAVSQFAFVEGLVEQVEDFRMGFFDFVEQNHGVRFLTDGFGEDAAFAEANVPRR